MSDRLGGTHSCPENPLWDEHLAIALQRCDALTLRLQRFRPRILLCFALRLRCPLKVLLRLCCSDMLAFGLVGLSPRLSVSPELRSLGLSFGCRQTEPLDIVGMRLGPLDRHVLLCFGTRDLVVMPCLSLRCSRPRHRHASVVCTGIPDRQQTRGC